MKRDRSRLSCDEIVELANHIYTDLIGCDITDGIIPTAEARRECISSSAILSRKRADRIVKRGGADRSTD